MRIQEHLRVLLRVTERPGERPGIVVQVDGRIDRFIGTLVGERRHPQMWVVFAVRATGALDSEPSWAGCTLVRPTRP